jgi:hypothetical protein
LSLTVTVACSLDEAALSKKELVVIETLEFKLLERHPYEVLETVLQGTQRGACLRTRVPTHAGAADASLGQYTTKCYALVNDTYRYTDLCMLQPPEVRRRDGDAAAVALTALLAPTQVVAIACLMLAADAPLSDAPAWAQRASGTDPEAVCVAIEELLQAYERPRLTMRATHIALSASDA